VSGFSFEFPDGEVIGHDEALETPFVAEDVPEEPLIGMRGDAVDFVIGSHDAQRAAFLYARFEGG